ATEPGQSRSIPSKRDGRREMAAASSSLDAVAMRFFARCDCRSETVNPTVFMVLLIAGPAILGLALTNWSTRGCTTADFVRPPPAQSTCEPSTLVILKSPPFCRQPLTTQLVQ
ncbi:unnamed protein product, partial [Ectocarpus sp. 12 AP-2014]